MVLPTHLFVSLLLFGCLAFTFGAEWTYHGENNNVDEWNDNLGDCGRSSQSPVDIDTDQLTRDSDLGDFTFANFDTASGVDLTLTNNGHTAQVTYTSGDLRVSGGGLGSEYRVLQLHFHWGGNNSVGSEHTIDGESYPIEMHVVTFNLKYDNLSNALQFQDGLAVLGVLFKLQGKNDPEENATALEDIADALQFVKRPGLTYTLPSMALETLLPEDTNQYYRYNGSLTTPPCFEVVTWTVFAQPLTIARKQLKKFRRLRSSEKKTGGGRKRLVNNFRPVQPLNGRQITYNF